MQNQQIIARIYSIEPDRPVYILQAIQDTLLSVIFLFDTPEGELTIKLPKIKREEVIGRRWDLEIVYFCEGIHEIVSAPIYWPTPNPSYIRAYRKRPKRG